MKKYKDTLILPKTNFPIKSSPKSEEERVSKWYDDQLFEKRIAMQSAIRPQFVLHDGPPYANGHLHHGHILNKVLKDIVVKSKFMAGYGVSFIPGWDCHGLPIEAEVDKQLGPQKKEMSKLEFRQKCREYAEGFVDTQRNEFTRLGVLAQWESPYLTMSKHYEAQTVRELAKFAKAGLLYRGSKPVFWCPTHRTALAEAEIEYKEDHVSTSACIGFKLKDKPSCRILVWTTTPWTLEGNTAVAVNADEEYVAYELSDPPSDGLKSIIFARKRAREVVGTFDEKYVTLNCKGSDLQGTQYELPIGSGYGVVVVSEHVTMESGTGCVHIAPAHGEDDFEIGKKYGLPIVNVINDNGRTAGGLTPKDSSEAILKQLSENGTLWSTAPFTHKYPYSARSHKPVIVKTAAQWFISVDKPFNGGLSLRERALATINKVKWIPGYGYNRIRGMLESRPDWCLSRQRTWGVPIPVFYDNDKPIVDSNIMESVADIFEKEGSDAWYKYDSDVLSGGKLSSGLRKEMDILDVWFDSGVSNAAVMDGQQADLYLEGSDQHRGWFQSTLLAALGARELIPYKAVMTHGFVVDENGEKLSKSKKNYVDPYKFIGQDGAEILRMWVASSDFTDDVRVSSQILEGVKQTYHRIRNTTRYLLASLSDFDPYMNMARPEELVGLERYIVLLAQQMETKVRKSYDDYDFCAVVKEVEHFCNIDLSSFYFDVVKDTLYCDSANSIKRRRIQTAMYRIARILMQIMSPIMCFTMDEAWECLPKLNKDTDSIHLANYEIPHINNPGAINFNAMIVNKYDSLRTIRRAVNISLEEIRNNKEIGAPYEAEVTIALPADQWHLISSADELKRICSVSKLTAVVGKTLEVKATHASGPQCQRCWNFTDDVGKFDPNDVCERCAVALHNG